MFSSRSPQYAVLLGGLAALLGGLLSAPVQAQGEGGKKPEPALRDLFDQPIRWSAPVQGARVSLHLVRTRLRYGEPLCAIVQTTDPSTDGPHLHLAWHGTARTAVLEFTTAQGEVVPFALQLLQEGAGLEGAYHVARLEPQGKFARGRYLTPGSYRLRLVVECKQDRSYATGWVGRVVSPEIAFEVLEEAPAGTKALVPPSLRANAEAWIRDLDAGDFRKREAAAKALGPIALEVLPLLEEVLASGSAEAAARARLVLLAKLKPVLDNSQGPFGYTLWPEAGPVLATFGEPTWQLLRERLGGRSSDALLTQAILFGPVDRPADLGKPTDKQAAQVVAQLNHADFKVRLRAVRGLGKTADERILKALVEQLADPFSYLAPSECRPVPFFPVIHEARAAIVWQGKAAIGPLIAFGRARETFRGEVARLLGEIGPDPRSLEFLNELLKDRSHDGRAFAVQALSQFGPEAAPLLFQRLQEAGEVPTIRRDTITALGKCGNAQTHGPFLMALLDNANYEFVGAAATALQALKARDALPALRRVARDERIDQNARYAALHAVVALAERAEAEGLLLELLEPQRHGGVRGVAMGLLAKLNCKKAIPKILDALTDADWYVRATADGALRVFAARPEGVGYDARRPDPAPWRAWWKEQR
jgi:HEAT repeat protein